MKTAKEAWRGDGLRRWRCSEERRAAPTCPASQGRIKGEVGCGQSGLEGLRVTLTGGGGRRRGLDEIWHRGRVSAPGNWLNELFGVQGCARSRGGVLTGKGMVGAVDALLRSCGTEEEERRGWGGPVQATPCGGKRRGGPSSVASRGGGRCGGPGAGRGGRRSSSVCEAASHAHSAAFDLK
jgi:hypothetical protein